MASQYLKERYLLRSDSYVHKFEELLPSQSFVLDLGCGAGAPVDDYLIKKGHLVTGIDISETQISLAKKYCPRGAFFVKDIMELTFGEYQVDGVISLYTFFHIPRERHGEMLKKVASFLPKGGKFLVSMGDDDFEGEHMLHGQKVWSSHFGPKRNRELVAQAGFDILLDVIDESGREIHQILLLEKA